MCEKLVCQAVVPWEGVGPSRRKLGLRGTLEGVGTSIPFLPQALLPGYHKVNSLLHSTLPATTCLTVGPQAIGTVGLQTEITGRDIFIL